MLTSIVRKTAPAVAFLVSSILAGGAQAQVVEWRGFAYMHSFSAGCAENGWSGAPNLYARFRPSGIGTNGASSRLSFFDRFYATNFLLPSGRFGRTFQTVQGVSLSAGLFVWPNETRLRILTQTPNNNNLSETTPQVLLSGEIRGFDNLPNCNVSFDATLLLRR